MKTIMKMFEHAHWANARLLDTIGSLDGRAHPKALRLFAHVVQAELVWLTRLNGRDSGAIAIWPEESSLEQLKRQAEHNREGYAAFLAGLEEAKLDTILRYRNQSGKEFESSVRDILTHVALHGHYHRGQINAWLREGGEEPINVDYIMYVR